MPEEKLFTETPMPQSDDIISADLPAADIKI